MLETGLLGPQSTRSGFQGLCVIGLRGCSVEPMPYIALKPCILSGLWFDAAAKILLHYYYVSQLLLCQTKTISEDINVISMDKKNELKKEDERQIS